jgi:hypothetical protein
MRARKGNKEEQQDPFEDGQPPGYHYNRQDRLSLSTAARFPDRGRGIFHKNRTLLIILLDLIIVLIIGVFLMRFLYAQVNRADLEGYSIVLRGTGSDDVVIAMLLITNRGADRKSERRVYARFSLVRNPDEEESTYVSGLAPRGEDEERILRATLPVSESSKVLYGEIRIGEAKVRLSTGLEP